MRVGSDLRFSIVPEWLTDHPDITPIALRVFVVMARYADKDTDEACRSRATLAERVRCSAAHLDRALRLLRDIGAVEWERQRDDRGDMPSRFTLHFSTPPLVAGDKPPLVAGEEPSSIAPDREGDTSEQVSPACPHLGCSQTLNHRGAHSNPWWDCLAEALYPGEGIPEHQRTRAGALVARCRRAGHRPERITEAAAWILREWGPSKLTLGSISEHYERATSAIAALTPGQVEEYLRDLERGRRRAALQEAYGDGQKPVPHAVTSPTEVLRLPERKESIR